MPHRIQICNYSFVASNGKKTVHKYDIKRSSLIGSTIEEIKADKTGRNMAQLWSFFLKKNKGHKNLREFKITLLSVEICTHTPNGKDLLRESYTNWD